MPFFRLRSHKKKIKQVENDTNNVETGSEKASSTSSSYTNVLQPSPKNTASKGILWNGRKKPKQVEGTHNVELEISTAESRRAALGLKVLHPNDNAIVDIVAVHGLNGHREETFTASNGVCWLKSLLPKAIPQIRVLTYGYNADTHSSSQLSNLHLHDHAGQLLGALSSQRTITKTTRRPIIFIGHSLGGLIVKNALTICNGFNASHLEDQKQILLSAYGILFMATPHQGSEGVALAEIVLNMMSIFKNTKTEYLKHLGEQSEWLDSLQKDYNSISTRFDTKYFYEEYATELPTGGSLYVVPKHSACVPGAVNAAPIVIFDNHRDMVRYKNAEDDGFRKVYGVLYVMLEKAEKKIDENWREWENIKAINQFPQISYCIPKNLPFARNPKFTGRQKELSAIEQALQYKDSDPPQQRIMVLYGLGGIGKSQLAIEYAYSCENDYTSIWWVNANTTATLVQGFLKIAQELVVCHGQIQTNAGRPPNYFHIATALQLPPDAVDQAGNLITLDSANTNTVIKAVQLWLANNSNQEWLLIVDNYDDPENVHIADFLPKSSTGSILVTSRALSSQRLGKSHEVMEIAEEDALEILRKSANKEITDLDRESALTIVKKLGSLPLALDQAGAYICAIRISFSQYLPRFEARFKEIAAKRPPKGVWSYEETVFTTWEVSFRALRSPAQELLLLCAFFDNEDIWEGLLPQKELKEKFGIDSVDDAIQEIFSLSLANRRHLEDSLWIHPMVHKWSHQRLEEYKRISNASEAISLVSAAISFEDDHEKPDNLALQRRLLPHIQVCSDHICREKYLGSSGTNTKQFKEVGLLAKTLTYHSQLAQVEYLLRWILHGQENILGADHNSLLSTAVDMGKLFHKLGKYDDAFEWYRRALVGQEKSLGKEDLSTLKTVNSMARVLHRQGKYNNALKWYRRALDGKEKCAGKDDDSTLKTVNNIAMVFSQKGKLDDALEWYERALAGYEKAKGKDHPLTLGTVNNLATVFKRQGNYDDALMWYRRALAGREEALGMDHPSTLGTIKNIALIFEKQEKYNDALEWIERALVGKEKALAKDHPSIENTRKCLIRIKEKIPST